METITSMLTGQLWTGATPIVFALLLAWSLVWKGMALWKSARLSHKGWFIALLIINTIGILEIIYIYFVARKYSVEVARTGTPEDRPM